MSLQILEPALLTTMQDLGRVGYQQFGVTRGGAMDAFALRAANRLVGNPDNDAAVEIVADGLVVRAFEKCIAAVVGAEYALRVNERAVPSNAALFLRESDVLTVDAPRWGKYAYLALAGGFDVPLVMQSRATDVRGGFGGLEGRTLRAGDVLQRLGDELPLERAGKMLSPAFSEYYRDDAPIRIIWGPHDEFFTDTARELFLASEYSISDLSDRMGTRLCGSAIARAERELLSCGMARGAIQIPLDGQPIVLQADHQTTGGYPILATVIRADVPRLAQKRAGERVAFHAVSVSEAQSAWRELVARVEPL